MSEKRGFEVLLIYATGLLQGLVLVTVPAASSVLTDPDLFAFSDSEYGRLFVPQVIMAVLGALFGPKLAGKRGLKPVFQLGIAFNLCAMGLIASSQMFQDQHFLAYGISFLGTTAVGAGFGLTLPMINVYAERLFPGRSASALTALHTLLGTGTALAPLLVTLLVRSSAWWLMPLASFAFLAIILAASFACGLKGDEVHAPSAGVQPADTEGGLSSVFWLFMLALFLYGFCETVFANWAIIYLGKEIALPAAQAGVALAVFWGAVTAGRLLVSFLTVWVTPARVYRVLPIMVAASLLGVSRISGQFSGIVLFGCAGLACSAFFPLSFSLAQRRFAARAEMVSGALMASYMVGYGAASYGIGQILQATGTPLSALYRGSSLAAVVMAGLAFALSRNHEQAIRKESL